MIRRKTRQTKQGNQTHGFSLLEMLAAAALVTGTVVPALVVIRDSMAQSRELHRRHLLANYAMQQVEEQSAVAATNWTNVVDLGDFAADGHSEIRYVTILSDNPLSGGIVNQLMSITAVIYDDINGNDVWDTTEINEICRTKVAKMNSYENEEQ